MFGRSDVGDAGGVGSDDERVQTAGARRMHRLARRGTHQRALLSFTIFARASEGLWGNRRRMITVTGDLDRTALCLQIVRI